MKELRVIEIGRANAKDMAWGGSFHTCAKCSKIASEENPLKRYLVTANLARRRFAMKPEVFTLWIHSQCLAQLGQE